MLSGNLPRLIAYSHLWIATAAACQAMLTRILVNLDPLHPVVAFIFFATLGTYSFYRLNKFKEVPGNSHYGWISKNRQIVAFIAALSVFAAATIAVVILPFNWIVICGIMLFSSLLYFFANGRNLLKIRKIFFLKYLIISIIWTVVTVSIPMTVEYVKISQNDYILMLLQRFLFILAIALPFDIREIEYERSAGIYAGLSKFKAGLNAALFRFVILAFAILVTVQCYLTPLITIGEAAGLLISATLASMVIDRQLQLKHELYFLLRIDGLLVFQFLLVLLFVIIE